MKPSIELMKEYVESHQPHGWKALAEFLEVSPGQVSNFKTRGGLPAAETLKVGLSLGYDVIELLKVIAVEAERKQEGKAYLLQEFGEQVSPKEFGGKGGVLNPPKFFV